MMGIYHQQLGFIRCMTAKMETCENASKRRCKMRLKRDVGNMLGVVTAGKNEGRPLPKNRT